MTYSQDFRRKVLDVRKKEGLSMAKTAKRFDVSKASIMRWVTRLEPKMTRNKPAVKIDMEALRRDVENHPDAYQDERAKRLGVSSSGICYALKRLGVTYKKKPQASKGMPRKTITLLPRDRRI